jgi:hypothetical protein
MHLALRDVSDFFGGSTSVRFLGQNKDHSDYFSILMTDIPAHG